MNRRSFLSAILKAGVAAAVLPAATTYARRWVKPAGKNLIEPFWFETSRASFKYDVEYQRMFVESFFFNKSIPGQFLGMDHLEDINCIQVSKPSSMKPIHWEFPSGNLCKSPSGS